MVWHDQIKKDTLDWLLEPDPPGVRYLALRDLMDIPADAPELQSAKVEAHRNGPIATSTGKYAAGRILGKERTWI